MKTAFLSFTFLLAAITANAQIQKGLDIDGETAGDYSGWSVSMPDVNTVAIGAPKSGGGGIIASNIGQVRVYTWNGNTWEQKGMDIDGMANHDQAGYSISMPDANTVAIGAPTSSGTNGPSAGRVSVYRWDGSNWVQKGLDLEGEGSQDRFGWSVSMPDVNTVGIGAPSNGTAGLHAGHVRIYTWDGSSWVQKGLSIDGEAAGDESGLAIDMPNSHTVAIGAPGNDQNGHVRIYSWDGNAWMQRGLDIDGEGPLSHSGYSVSMPDDNTVGIGGPRNDGNVGSEAGHVRVFSWNGSAWDQKGMDINGDAWHNHLGHSVSMPNANTIAVGAPQSTEPNIYGHVRIYGWKDGAWVQRGWNINGEAASDFSGYAICMADNNTIAIGATSNDGASTNAGHVRIYEETPIVGVTQPGLANSIVMFPNPSQGDITIQLDKPYSELKVMVQNELGQEVLNDSYPFTNTIKLNLEGKPGTYIITLTTGDETTVLKALKM